MDDARPVVRAAPAGPCTSRGTSPTTPAWPATCSRSSASTRRWSTRPLADPTTHDEVKADHDRVVAAGGYGVPTLFFPDGQCLFGPVVIDPPTDGGSVLRLWHAVTAWLEFPHLYELQRPKTGADGRFIAQTFRPYLEARDWVSIDRGRVVDLDRLASD